MSKIYSSVYFKSFLILLFFVIFAYFRFHFLDKRIPLGWDQAQFSTQVRNIIVNKKFTLLGPRINNDRGFFLAPYFTYIIIPFYMATKLHPMAMYYFVIVFNVFFFIASLYFIKKIYSFLHWVIFISIWAIIPSIILSDTTPWWPIYIPLGVLMTSFCLYSIYQKQTFFKVFLLGIILGFFSNMHFQFIFINLFSVCFLIFLFISKEKSSKNSFLYLTTAFFGFVITLAPLFLFDIRHNFLNARLFMNFFLPQPNQPSDIWAWVPVFNNFVASIIFVNNKLASNVFFFLISGAIVYLFMKKKGFFKVFYMSFFIIWCLYIPIFALYGKRPSEYYFNFLYPFIYLVVIDVLFVLKKQIVSIFFILVLFYVSLEDNIQFMKPVRWSLYEEDLVIQKMIPFVSGKKFNVSFDIPLGWSRQGYDYLIEYYGIKQSGNWSDPLVQIRIPPKEKDIVIGSIGLSIPAELR